MYRIFVVEDDAVIASAVQRHLESWGYQVACAVRFDDVLSDFAAFDPQLVLLDISLPFFNGYHWCREIRKVSKVPILFLTSASDDMNLVMAMEMGGDDLLAKPFHLQVLSAKVQAMLRRAYDFAGTAQNIHQPRLLHIAGNNFGRYDKIPERVQDLAAFAGAPGRDRQPGGHHDPAVGIRQLCG